MLAEKAENLCAREYNTFVSDAVHGVEDVFPLDANGKGLLFPSLGQDASQFANRDGAGRDVHQHNHGKIFFHDSLANVQDIDFMLRQQGAYKGGNAYTIFSNNGDNSIQKNTLSFIR